MKVNKTQALMFILELLIKNKQISKSDIQDQISISDVTFRRYIQEVRAYLNNFDMPYSLIYSKLDDIYYLKNN